MNLSPAENASLSYALADSVRPHAPHRATILDDRAAEGLPPEPTFEAERVNGQKRIYFRSEIVDAGDLFLALFDTTDDPLTCFVDSPGGVGDIGLRIAQALVRRGNTTMIIDRALSAAAFIALAGTHRKISRAGRIMFHSLQSLCLGDVAEMRRHIERMERLQAEGISFVAQQTGQSRELVATWFEKETNFDSESALRYGLVHEIWHSPHQTE